MKIELDADSREAMAELAEAMNNFAKALAEFGMPVEAGDIAEEIRRLRMELT